MPRALWRATRLVAATRLQPAVGQFLDGHDGLLLLLDALARAARAGGALEEAGGGGDAQGYAVRSAAYAYPS